MSSGIFVSSIPKSGTHLLSSLIQLWSRESVVSVKEKNNCHSFDFSKYSKNNNLVGHYRISHVKSNESLYELFRNRRIVVAIRDPRDLCNSMLHYVMKGSNLNHRAAAQKLIGLSYERQIMSIAKGVLDDDGKSITPNLNKWCSGFVELASEFDAVKILKYEDFFENELILNSLSDIFEISHVDAENILSHSLSSNSKTKRDGGARPFQWKGLYSRELKRFFEKDYSSTIEYLGYEV